jgi:hypothetical protein
MDPDLGRRSKRLASLDSPCDEVLSADEHARWGLQSGLSSFVSWWRLPTTESLLTGLTEGSICWSADLPSWKDNKPQQLPLLSVFQVQIALQSHNCVPWKSQSRPFRRLCIQSVTAGLEKRPQLTHHRTYPMTELMAWELLLEISPTWQTSTPQM